MTPNPALGVLFHWLGGLASGSFYVPFRGVKRWSWETYWLVGGFFSWIIAPWVLGMIMTNDLVAVIREAPGSTIFWCYFWGLLWGLGRGVRAVEFANIFDELVEFVPFELLAADGAEEGRQGLHNPGIVRDVLGNLLP